MRNENVLSAVAGRLATMVAPGSARRLASMAAAVELGLDAVCIEVIRAAS
jgi:hypothetical protein